MSRQENIERKRRVLRTLRETGNVSETARRLGLDRTTIQKMLKRMGLTSQEVIHPPWEPEPKPKPKPSDTPAPFTEEEMRAMEAHGWPRHECPGDGCAICQKFLDERDNGGSQPSPCECGRANCPGNHRLNPASFGLAPKPTWTKLAMSYGPRRKPWER